MVFVNASRIHYIFGGQFTLIVFEPVFKLAVLEDALESCILSFHIANKANYLLTTESCIYLFQVLLHLLQTLLGFALEFLQNKVLVRTLKVVNNLIVVFEIPTFVELCELLCVIKLCLALGRGNTACQILVLTR